MEMVVFSTSRLSLGSPGFDDDNLLTISYA